MTETARERAVSWYRTPLDRETLKQLNQRSDVKGLIQTLGHLGLLCATGGAAVYAAEHLMWPIVVIAIFLHGTVYAFLLNGWHELCHGTVFKTKSLNLFFLRLFSFLGWFNHVKFQESHNRHHQYTLHPPDDLEVVLPIELSLRGYLAGGFVNVLGCYYTLQATFRWACGRLNGDWERALFPESAHEKRRQLFGWARFLFVGHAIIIGVAFYTGWWLLPILTTFAPFYGSWLLFLCNYTQHVGLKDNVPDFRLSCRTVILNPIVRFLYWHMNFHIEHHMYAAVPCYNLGKLHSLIKHDLPKPKRGLFAVWTEIIGILHRQKSEPSYQYVQPLPAGASGFSVADGEGRP